MAAWEWIALGLGLLVVLQLVALQYARRMGSDESDAPVRATPGTGSESVPISDPDPPRGTGKVVCPSCGTQNDPAYSFCRECVGRLA